MGGEDTGTAGPVRQAGRPHRNRTFRSGLRHRPLPRPPRLVPDQPVQLLPRLHLPQQPRGRTIPADSDPSTYLNATIASIVAAEPATHRSLIPADRS